MYMLRALPLGVGVGKEGKIKRQDHLTCLNQNRQVEISLHSCEHWFRMPSGVSSDVTLHQGGQIHSLRAA